MADQFHAEIWVHTNAPEEGSSELGQIVESDARQRSRDLIDKPES